jgi:hypothetical protein
MQMQMQGNRENRFRVVGKTMRREEHVNPHREIPEKGKKEKTKESHLTRPRVRISLYSLTRRRDKSRLSM